MAVTELGQGVVWEVAEFDILKRLKAPSLGTLVLAPRQKSELAWWRESAGLHCVIYWPFLY